MNVSINFTPPVAYRPTISAAHQPSSAHRFGATKPDQVELSEAKLESEAIGKSLTELIPDVRGTMPEELRNQLEACDKAGKVAHIYKTQAAKEAETKGEQNDPKSPLVSVVVPTFKAEKTISRALDSIAEQTYQNKEIVIVDDGSEFSKKYPDQGKTRQAVLAYMQQHPKLRIKFITLPLNTGYAAAARNAAKNQSNGSIIAFMDDDDKYTNSESIFKLAVKFKRKTLAVIGDYNRADAKGRILNKGVVKNKQRNGQNIQEFNWQLAFNILHNQLPACAMRRECFEQPYFKIGEDLGQYLALYNLAAKNNSSNPAECIEVIPEQIYDYCVRQDSLMSDSSFSNLQRFSEVHNLLQTYYPLEGLSIIPQIEELKKSLYTIHFRGALSRSILRDNQKQTVELLDFADADLLSKSKEALLKDAKRISRNSRIKSFMPAPVLRPTEALYRFLRKKSN